MPIIEGAIPRDATRQAVITGGLAGAHTVTGIKPRDKLVSVLRAIGAGVDVTDITNITSEFTISAVDTIDNTSGTNTTGDKLIITWLSVG